MELRPYMCFCGDASEGAVLAWAYDRQHARKLAYPAIADWTDCGFIDVRARLLKDCPAYYETLRLKDGPHVNDNPPVCPSCEMWGHPLLPDGKSCEHCGE
jgi:hypothetical protein